MKQFIAVCVLTMLSIVFILPVSGALAEEFRKFNALQYKIKSQLSPASSMSSSIKPEQKYKVKQEKIDEFKEFIRDKSPEEKDAIRLKFYDEKEKADKSGNKAVQVYYKTLIDELKASIESVKESEKVK